MAGNSTSIFGNYGSANGIEGLASSNPNMRGGRRRRTRRHRGSRRRHHRSRKSSSNKGFFGLFR